MTFEELAAQRRLLKDFCGRHESSLLAFRRSDGCGFRMKMDEVDLPDEPWRHLTSTATCIDSLLGCPPRFLDRSKPEVDARGFAEDAIKRAPNRWQSEGSAHIYCRCRALPLTIEYLRDYSDVLPIHVRRILRQLESDPSRFGIGEKDVGDAVAAAPRAERDWYPPNAFHTYWTLETLSKLKGRFKQEYDALSLELHLPSVIEGMLLWSRRTLGYQVALHAADSSFLDSDQLAWSLAALLKFGQGFPEDLGEQDFLREALKQLFKTQLPVGTWRHYRSLFHYSKAGNAYCFVFETFSVLLGIALDGTAGRQLYRDSLLPYVGKLIDLWRYAVSTRVPLDASDTAGLSAVGWSSGHRFGQTLPESWATASVFAFCQALRRLLGVWTRESARSELNLVKPVFDEPTDDVLSKRGDTWTQGTQVGVTERLYTMFINPVLMRGKGDSLEPDAEIIHKHQARSAILFGPPGTSKTTLAKAVAKSIGWDYVELHASHFVSEGLQNVQRRADEIFGRLMEIDRAVVLFDEIDELVRERLDEHDAFGRFLTTSMLPKLAELWEQRRIIYFVATNHIKYFDRAITRSQRFDALILVSPPSYETKMTGLRQILQKPGSESVLRDLPDFKKRMWEALERAGKSSACEADRNAALEDNVLAKFVLLRWDQLDELAYHLGSGAAAVDEDAIKVALGRIADQKLMRRAPYIEFMEDLQYARRDFDKELVWRANGFDEEIPPVVIKLQGAYWLVLRHADEPPATLQGRRLKEHDGKYATYAQAGAE